MYLGRETSHTQISPTSGVQTTAYMREIHHIGSVFYITFYKLTRFLRKCPE